LIISVYAIIHEINAIGIKTFPIIKYHSTERRVPKNKFLRKEAESGSQGKDRKIHVSPTNTYNRFLNLKYFKRIIKPIEKDIIT
jgi:hypothetical protein